MKGVETKDGCLLLDATKLPWHYDRVEAWEAGERIAPVSIDMSLGRQCQASCRGCYAQIQEPHKRSTITLDDGYALLEDCALMGVRGISLVSDGESTLSPLYVPFILRASALGIDVGNATNGWLLNPETSEKVLPHLRWVRFTVLAGNPKTYVRMMHHDPSRLDVFWNAMRNIATAVRIKRQRSLGVTLGIQTFIMPQDASEVFDFARLALDLGVDYAVIKATADDERGSLGVPYQAYPDVYSALRQAEAMSTEETKVIVKWEKLKAANRVPYQRMYATQFLLQISGSGLVAPSGMFFNDKYAKMHIGDFTEQRFYDIWQSKRYWEVQDYLASDQFDAQRMMGYLPIQHYPNVALDRHVKGIERITPKGEPLPLHVNFV